MDDNRTSVRRRTFVRFGEATEPRRRLFCLPFAGGGPSIYRLWPQSLPHDVEVVAIALPGRDPRSRQTPLGSVGEIVPALVEAFDAMEPGELLPFAVFGHSMGALIAYELTVALEQSGRPAPSELFVSGRRAPDELGSARSIHGLSDDEFLDEMHRRYGGVPDAVRREPDLLALLLPALRADVRTFETYVRLTDHKVRCPVHVYGGQDDTHPNPDQLIGWQRVAEGDVTVQLFPGDHFYLNESRLALTADIAARWPSDPAAERA